MPERLREDEAAFAGTHHRRTYLDLLELQYSEDRSGGEGKAIGSAIRDWVTEHPAGTIALPAGAGCSRRLIDRWLRRLRRRSCSFSQHPDHLLVRDAALRALGGSGAALLLYEEVPYLWGAPADREVERVAARAGLGPEPFELGVDRELKAERIGAYASQIPYISPPHGRVDEAETLPPRERYWRLDSSTSS